METLEEKNFINTANNFENYFSKIGFQTIINNIELRKISMEHDDGRSVMLFTNHSGLDFVITGYNFSA